ncbi:MAG: tetratricopeptide repeat protein [Spirochaetales bacterium]|nr:tetratricopeptide repeat protein [Spirochaetales bacterium]
MAYQDLFERCRLALKMQDIQLAEKLSRTIVEKSINDPTAYILLGNVYTAKKEINNAIQAYQHSIELQANNPEAYNNIGMIYRQEGNLPAAFKALETALSLAPDRADISYNLGNICRAQGKNSQAIVYFKKAVEINPEFILGYNSLALSSQQEGKTQDALRYFHQALEIDTNHPTIRLNLGSLEEEAGRLEQALAHYRIAARSKPGWIIGLKRLANTQFRLRRFTDAEITFSKIISTAPGDLEARLNLSVCVSESGRLEEAQGMLRSLLAKNRKDTRILELLARICVKNGQFDEAETFYRDILAVAPNALSVRTDLAELFIRRNKFKEAAEQLRYVLAKDNSQPKAYYILGRLARQQGEIKKAVESFEVLMSVDPGFSEGRFQLANLYREQKQFRKAVDQLKLLLGKNRYNLDARKLMAELYYEQNLYSEALTHFLALFKEKPEDEFIIDSIKKCYDALGEKEKAISFAESLLAKSRKDNSDDIDDLSQLEHTLNMYDSIIEKMPEDFARKMNRNLQRLNSDDEEDQISEDLPEQHLYIQDIHEIANESVPIIDVGGIEPVIAVNEEDRETIFLDEMEEALEEYPELEEDEDIGRFEGSLSDKTPGGRGADGSGSEGRSDITPQPIVIPPPSWAKPKTPPAREPHYDQPYPEQPYTPPYPQGGSGSFGQPSGFQERRKNSPPAANAQGGSVNISIPPVITIRNGSGKETAAIEKKKGAAPKKPAEDRKKEAPSGEKPVTGEDKKNKADKKEEKKEKKKKRKPLFGRKKKDRDKKDRKDDRDKPEKSEAQKREDLFSYLANLTQFLPSDAKKDFQKSGVMNKINKIREKLDTRGGFGSQLETLFPEKQKPVHSPDRRPAGRFPEEKIVDTLSFMTKLTEHLPQKADTLEIRDKIEHILATIRRGKDGRK